MDTQPTFGPNDLLAHIVGDIANAVSERAGESGQQRHDRREAATNTIMTFQPHDAIEAMFAGHCVMFHEMIVDSVNETMRGKEPAARLATRSGIVAMDKAFGNYLVRLEHYRKQILPIRDQDGNDWEPPHCNHDQHRVRWWIVPDDRPAG